jgi:hypothetical protein
LLQLVDGTRMVGVRVGERSADDRAAGFASCGDDRGRSATESCVDEGEAVIFADEIRIDEA